MVWLCYMACKRWFSRFCNQSFPSSCEGSSWYLSYYTMAIVSLVRNHILVFLLVTLRNLTWFSWLDSEVLKYAYAELEESRGAIQVMAVWYLLSFLWTDLLCACFLIQFTFHSACKESLRKPFRGWYQCNSTLTYSGMNLCMLFEFFIGTSFSWYPFIILIDMSILVSNYVDGV